MRVFDYFLDLIYPPRCLVCAKPGAFVHQECRSKLPYLIEPLCKGCGIPLILDSGGNHLLRCKSSLCLLPDNERALDKVVSTFAHTGGAREAALRLKYKGVSSLGTWLGAEMAKVARQRGLNDPVYVIPVPLHKKRLQERGYNQAKVLASALGQQLGIPFLENRLIRYNYTRSQVGLSVMQRARNVADAFEWRGLPLNGECLLLVDDVCTTGSTLNACAHALKKAGAGKVVALTLTREFTL